MNKCSCVHKLLFCLHYCCLVLYACSKCIFTSPLTCATWSDSKLYQTLSLDNYFIFIQIKYLRHISSQAVWLQSCGITVSFSDSFFALLCVPLSFKYHNNTRNAHKTLPAPSSPASGPFPSRCGWKIILLTGPQCCKSDEIFGCRLKRRYISHHHTRGGSSK